MSEIVVYPGTFDPITNGHLSIIKRASKMFDHIIIAVADNYKKVPLFTSSERKAMAKDVIVQLGYDQQISVETFSGLLSDFLEQHNAHIILRGLRTAKDFDYEIQMSHINHKLNDTIESIFLMAREPHTCISSSWVKELARLGADLHHFVPAMVAKKVTEKLVAGDG